jgi:spore germination protein GerM
MTAGRLTAWISVALVVAGAVAAALFVMPGWLAQRGEHRTPVEAPPPAATRHIKATLFYVSEDGLRLVPVEREVPFADNVVDQARHLLEAQLQPAPSPLLSAIPKGTTLRAVYESDRSEAFVDLSPEVATAHSGGALDELLTVYSIVHVLTTNLPAVSAVQILVNGHEVDTLAGHVDLRRPLTKSELLIQLPGGPAAAAAPGPAPGITPSAETRADTRSR